MSRIGKKPIIVPNGVEVSLEKESVSVKGPRGQISLALHPHVSVSKQDHEILVHVKKEDSNLDRSLWGLFRNLIQNMVLGVTQEFEKKLEIYGVGYKVSLLKDALLLSLGFSHPIEFSLPKGITASVEKNTITLSGIDKQLVGETAARIRRLKRPEPYKGKGIKYTGEVIRRKAGKAAKAAG